MKPSVLSQRSRRPSARSVFGALAAGLMLVCGAEGCTLEMEREAARRDTVRLVDTVVRVETVAVVDTVVDTVWALGSSGDGGGAAAAEMRAGSGPVAASDLAYLASRRLLVPVAGVAPDGLPDTFDEMRGSRRHEALDIMAPRGTPVVSADAGRVEKLHTSVGGGLTVYAADPSGRFIYYYAHLDRYRAGLREGAPLARGDTIGYVGSTGNASPDAPHLHFAVARMDADRRWWKGTPIDPRPFLVTSGATGATPRR